MHRRYVFTVQPLMEGLMFHLSETIGLTAYYMNIYWVADRALELFFQGPALGDANYMHNFLKDLNIPTEIKDRITSKFHKDFNILLLTVIPDYKPNHSYTYELTDLGDVIVLDLGNSSMAIQEPQDDFLKNIEEAINNGDYIPERLRRMVY